MHTRRDIASTRTAHRRRVARPHAVQIPPPPHCLTALGQRASCPLHDISRKDFGLLTSDFANRPFSEVRCLLSNLKLTARKGNNRREEVHGNRKCTQWKAVCGKSARTV